MVAVNRYDIELAFSFVNSGAPMEHNAYMSLDTGQIYWVSELDPIDEEVPEDLETSDRYIAFPHKNELGLGCNLALSFVEDELPDRYHDVEAIFRRKGAICTGGDRCQPEVCDETADACVPGVPFVCNDEDPCTDDVCDPSILEGDPCLYTDNGTCFEAQGCTPGFWKNNASKKGATAWPETIRPNHKIKDHFVIPACVPDCMANGKKIGDNTLLQALNFGGSGACGRVQMLLRHATAALLNATSDCVDYGMTAEDVVEAVNEALASCTRAQWSSVGTHLDELNNEGCPLNQAGECQNSDEE